MIRSEGLFFDCQGTLQERLFLGVVTSFVIKQGEIIKRGCHSGVAGSERLLINSQSALIQGLGFGVAFGSIKLSEVVEHICQKGMLRAKRLLFDCYGALKQWLGLHVVAFVPIKYGEAIKRDSHKEMLRPKHLLIDCQ